MSNLSPSKINEAELMSKYYGEPYSPVNIAESKS